MDKNTTLNLRSKARKTIKQMACNLLSFQGLQAERRDSIPLRSTTRPVEKTTGLLFWQWLDVIRSKKNTTLTCDHKSGNILS